MASLPAFSPPTPFIGRLTGGFRPSFMIRLKARINGNGRCNIDFINTPDIHSEEEIVLHISMRPEENDIVRNHAQDGDWGEEERGGQYILKSNEAFEMVILAEFHQYKIALNGKELGTFRHRLPMSWVEFIRVSGNTTIEYVLFEQDQSSAQQQMIVTQVSANASAPMMSIPNQMPMQMQTHITSQSQPPQPFYPNQPGHPSQYPAHYN